MCCGSTDEVEQIVVNICNNAAQAIGHTPGRITLLLDRHETTEPGPSLLPPGSYCRLRVIDDGPGMDEEVREHIFEPFFTTKPAGQGTGLGLAMVQRTMSEMGGAVHCTSEPGEGTMFELFFPQALAAAQEHVPNEAQMPDLGAGERILLVDDEQILANLAASFLTQAGYRVTKFYDPDSALGAFRAHPHDYDILLTDLAMPSMTGVDLAAQMRALRPELPVVLCTGYGGDPSGAMHKHCDVVLGKPCGRVELYSAIREAFALQNGPAPAAQLRGSLDFKATA
jgi:CheY-like chemotaxis protein/anti-sigma regulatory factor (Ser/Thr protein kinase)